MSLAALAIPTGQPVLDALEDLAVIQLDLRGTIQGWNRGAELIFGYPLHEVQNRSIACLHRSSTDVTQNAETLLKVARERGHARESGWRIAKSGRELWVEVSVHLLRDQAGRPIGYVESVRDATRELATTERLRALLEASAYAVIATDLHGTITVFSRAAERLLGYRAEELVGRTNPAIFHIREEVESRSEELSRALGRVIAPGFETFVAWTSCTGNADERRWTYVHKDGHQFPILLSVTPLRDPSGGTIGYLGIARDMTALNQAELELAEQKERLRVIFEAAIDGTFLLDEAGALVDVNPAMERLFGCSRDELLVENLGALVPGYLGPHGSGAPGNDDEPLLGPRAAPLHEGAAHRRDGSWFQAELSLNAASLRGRRMYVGTLRDISARKATEQERDRLKRLIEATPDFVGMADPEGNILYENPAARRLLGRDDHAASKGRSITSVYPGWAATWLREHVVPKLLEEGSFSFETSLQHADGTEIPVSQVAMLHRNREGEVEYLSTIIRDLRSQKRSEALLAKVATQVEGMLYQFELAADGTRRLPYASAGSLKLFEATPEELARTDSSIRLNVVEEDLPEFERSIRLSAENLTPWVAEYRFRRKDGTIRYHRGQSIPEKRKDGSIVWHGFVSDITELREATLEAKRARAELERAIAVLDAGFAMFDSDERLIICNDRYAELYKLTPEQRHSRPTYEAMVRECFQNEPIFYSYLPAGMDFEAWLRNRLVEFRNPEGPRLQRLGERWVRIDEQRTENGGVVCLRTDITALKEAEFEARLLGERVKLAAETAGLGIWELDVPSGALNWDERMFQIYACARRDFSGNVKDWSTRLHPADVERTAAAFQKSFEQDRDFQARFRIVHPDGTLRYIEARSTKLRDPDGKGTRVLGVNLDITEHVTNEQRLEQLVETAQAATKAKADFLATMSHEIRTPMNGVIGMTNLLMGTDLEGEQREYVETIRSSGESLLTLINDILDFSKMEAGRLVLERAPFSLEQVMIEAINLFTTQAEAKGLSLTHTLPDAPPMVVGDQVRVRQILLNLISNALKFTQEGEVQVSVSFERSSETHAEVAIRVRDTGIGMTPEYLGRLGEAFLQADASTTRQFGGTGLGLSICKSLVDLMGGTIVARSVLHQGTTFEVLLPMNLLGPGEVAPSRSKPVQRVAQRLKRVLVAEDNLVNQRVVVLMLKNLAEEIVLAVDGREAVEKFQSGNFDCVLMDGQMPEMDGLEATRRIRGFEAATARRRTPIIALTANALPGDREAFLGAGMDEYLTKPVRLGDLVAALTRVVPLASSSPTP